MTVQVTDRRHRPELSSSSPSTLLTTRSRTSVSLSSVDSRNTEDPASMIATGSRGWKQTLPFRRSARPSEWRANQPSAQKLKLETLLRVTQPPTQQQHCTTADKLLIDAWSGRHSTSDVIHGLCSEVGIMSIEGSDNSGLVLMLALEMQQPRYRFTQQHCRWQL